MMERQDDDLSSPSTVSDSQQSKKIARTRRRFSRSDLIVAVLLMLVIGLGGYFRFYGLNWDDYVRFHPDERFLTGNVLSSIDRGWLSFTGAEPTEQQMARCLERNPDTSGVGGYFDTQCSDWNPHNVGQGLYVYGTLPLFVAEVATSIAADLFDDPANPYDGDFFKGYNGGQIIWRAISALCDTLIILIVFFIGKRLHGKWTGLLAATLYAFAVFPIQQAHFGTTDPMTNLFVTLSIFMAVRVQDTGNYRDYLGFGLAFGLALASRVNIAPVVGLVIVASGMRMLPAFVGNMPTDERNRSLLKNFNGLVLAGIITILVFRIFNPYAFEGPSFFGVFPNERWLDDIATAQHLVGGEADSPPNYQWLNRTDYLFPLSNMVLWGMGIGLGVVAWLAWLWSGWRVLWSKPKATRNLLLFGWVLVYFGWLGANWVATMRYFLPLYPTLTILGAWALIELYKRARQPQVRVWRRYATTGLVAGVTGFTLLWALMFTNIYRNPATFVQATYWVWEQVPGDFAMRVEGYEDAPLLNVGMLNRPAGREFAVETRLYDQATFYQEGVPQSGQFTPAVSGQVSSVHIPHLGDPFDDPDPETLNIVITRNVDSSIIATANLTADLTRDEHPIGSAYDVAYDEPFEVVAGESYTLTVTVTGGPVIGSGAVMARESTWEEGFPAKVCTIPQDGQSLLNDGPPAIMYSNDCNRQYAWEALIDMHSELETHWEDDAFKRDRMLTILEETDYIVLPSNRRYDTQSRNVSRFPMTTYFYDELFAGELGFELVGAFEETFEWGPFRVSDQNLPTYDTPDWVNEYEAEEAFHVYDHPTVFIFRKVDDYDHSVVTASLLSIPLTRATEVGVQSDYVNGVIGDLVPGSTLNADIAPTQLQFTADMAEIQTENGTWSNRFNSDSLINTEPVVTILVWWLVLLVIGFLMFPIMFTLFPRLADRGYGFAKFLGVFLMGWGTWVLATLRIPAWSQVGLIGALIVLGFLSAIALWYRRDEIMTFLRDRWYVIVWIDLIAFAMFFLFVQIRMSNPDLWVVGFGGEKPMDFAYFNGVLRSTIFPPIDPWFAGGYLNYYYFGFVIVGVPTLLTGTVPAIAYNLILPMLFSFVGVGAFSIAFNVVSAWRTPDVQPDEPIRDDDGQPSVSLRRRRMLGNPWLAGVMAMLLVVVLGNLDIPRTFAKGVAELGGYSIPQGMEHYLIERFTDDYVDETGQTPQGDAILQIANQVTTRLQEDRFSDRVDYEIHKVTSLVNGLIDGTIRMLNGETPPIGTERWFWAPTRVITEIPELNNAAITEMPAFTFIYADLHAHMIAMPGILFAVLFVFSEFILAGNDRRNAWLQFFALAIGAIVIGMSKAVNTWDWPTLMMLSVIGLSYTWWLTWGKDRFSRQGLTRLGLRVGGFILLTFVASYPYDAWYATTSTDLIEWTGGKTRLWAYLDIYGLFLFLIISLLTWETHRWLSSVQVRALKGRLSLFVAGVFALAVVWLISVLFFFNGERILLVALPLVAWVAVLFFRPNNARSMRFVLVLIGLSLSITMGVEFITITADSARQNTVFKFYIQVWLFLSVVGGIAFSWLFNHSERWGGVIRGFWYVSMAILLFIAGLFPFMALRAKNSFRLSSDVPYTLDGMTYMRTSSYSENGAFFSLDGDYEIIRYLQENIEGSPVIMEGHSNREYAWGGRISIYTGLPSVVGWRFHQTQQRTIPPMQNLVNQRRSNVNAFYSLADIDMAMDILGFYNVEYVILSDLERALYGQSGGLDKFAVLVDLEVLSPIFTYNDSVIYQVNHDTLSNFASTVALNVVEGD